jgi:hypothetical protein
VQGEEADSSDEEWAHDYAAMDPASQQGWRNRRGPAEGPAEELMRDIMEAADVVHSNSMGDMAASRTDVAGSPPFAEAAMADSMARSREGSTSPSASVEVDQEGA